MHPLPRFGPHRLALAIAGIALAADLSLPAVASTIHVRPDGSGDALTIAAGLALAHAGDEVLVAPGTYSEHDLQLGVGVALRSEAGRSVTVIDVQHLGHGVIGANGATVQGFWFIHSGGLNLFSVYAYETSPAILDNLFDRSTWMDVILYHSASEVRGNEFIFSPDNHGIALLDGNSSSPLIQNNVFEASDPNGNISAIELSDVDGAGPPGVPRILDNRIVGRVWLGSVHRNGRAEMARNVCIVENGYSEAVNIAFDNILWLHHNTFVGGSGIFAQGSGNDVIFDHNIVAHGRSGIEWASSGGALQTDCNDVFPMSWFGAAPGPTDFSADPMFCDRAHRDLQLMELSPCAPKNAPCGLVGALPVACTSTAAVRSTWGRVKSLYR